MGLFLGKAPFPPPRFSSFYIKLLVQLNSEFKLFGKITLQQQLSNKIILIAHFYLQL